MTMVHAVTPPSLGGFPKGYTTLLLEGVAMHLATNGVGQYIPDDVPGGVYTEEDLAIVLKQVPAFPPRLITLNTYTPVDHPHMAYSTVQVQFRIRAPHTECDDIADYIYGVFHQARYLDLVAGYPAISHIARVSSIPLGEDSNGWAERTDNYTFAAQRQPHPAQPQ